MRVGDRSQAPRLLRAVRQFLNQPPQGEAGDQQEADGGYAIPFAAEEGR